MIIIPIAGALVLLVWLGFGVYYVITGVDLLDSTDRHAGNRANYARAMIRLRDAQHKARLSDKSKQGGQS